MNQKELFPTGNVLPSTSSVGASPASPLVLPGSKEAKKILVTSGRQCLKLLNEKNPNIRLSKMLVGSSMWHSMMCVLTWKVKVTPRNRLLFQLQASVPRIKDKDAGSSESLWSIPTASDRYSAHMKPNEKGIPHDIAKGNLRGEVKFWPTPTVDNNEHKNLKLDEKGRRIASKSGGGTHSLNLADTVNMWPTPAVADTEGGEQSKRVERTDSGSYILRKKNKPEMTYGAKLSDAILFEEKQKMWATPTAMDHLPQRSAEATKKLQEGHRKGRSRPSNLREQVDTETMKLWPTAHNAKEGAYPAEFKRNTPSLVIEAQRRNDSGDQSAEDLPNTTSGEAGTEKVKANLNPDWVEWLMGYPEGYSDTEKTEKQSINEHEGWWFEPDIPRITPRKDLRTKRLKCLGNSIVPQIMVEIGKAILEQEKKDAS